MGDEDERKIIGIMLFEKHRVWTKEALEYIFTGITEAVCSQWLFGRVI